MPILLNDASPPIINPDILMVFTSKILSLIVNIPLISILVNDASL